MILCCQETLSHKPLNLFPSSVNTAWFSNMKAMVCLVLNSLRIFLLNFLGAPMCKCVCVCVSKADACGCVCQLMGGVPGFVFWALWGQTGSAELTMHLLVCNQPETSSKQTQSCWTETHNIHIFHLATNLLAYTKIPTAYGICGAPWGLERCHPDRKSLGYLMILLGSKKHC